MTKRDARDTGPDAGQGASRDAEEQLARSFEANRPRLLRVA